MRRRTPWAGVLLVVIVLVLGLLPGVAQRPAAAAPTPDLVPLTPVRVWDSRPEQPRGTSGRPAGQLRPGVAVRIPVAGTPGLAAGARALVLNATATGVRSKGHLTVWPCGSPRPRTSTLNAAPGEDTANQVTVAVDRTRAVCAASSVPLHLVLDASAYAPATTALSVAAPFRLLDTRSASVPRPVTAGTVLRVPVAGRHSVPTGIGLALVNVTVTGAAARGYATAYPCGDGVPAASTLNYLTGESRANAAWVRLDNTGSFCISSSATAHVIIGVSGHAPRQAEGVVPVAPDRVVDTRSAWGLASSLQPGVTAAFSVGQLTKQQGYRGALLLNATVTGQQQPGHLTLWPCGAAAPRASSLNFAAFRDRANAVAVAAGADGRVCVRSSTATHVVIDATGYVNPPGGGYRYVPVGPVTTGTSGAETAMLRAINAARAVGRTCGSYGSFPPASALQRSRHLADAAQRHGDAMASGNFFSHTGSDGSRVGERISRTGLRWSLVGENLAGGYATAGEAVAALLRSPGHCRTMMDRRFTHVGIGYSYRATSTYQHYWVQVFAALR
jgi:uncharacterized protein YkwD